MSSAKERGRAALGDDGHADSGQSEDKDEFLHRGLPGQYEVISPHFAKRTNHRVTEPTEPTEPTERQNINQHQQSS